MDAAQAVPRRVPVPRMRPPLDRFPSTGIEITEGARVIIVPDEIGVGTALVTSHDAPSLEMVYKLVQDEGGPVMKTSSGKASRR